MVRVLFLALSLMAASGSLFAQELIFPPRLGLEEALRLAEERNPALAAARATVDAAAADVVGARQRPNPVVSVDTENYPLFDPDRPSFGNNQQLTIRLDQEIELAGRRRLRTAAAGAGLGAAEAAARDEWRRLALDVRRSYLAIVLATADVDVAQRTLDEIDRVIALNRARYQQGEISGVEVRRIQVERLRFVDDVFNARLALRNARGALLALLNAPDLSVAFDVTETLTAPPGTPAEEAGGPLDGAALQRRALDARPDLAASRLTVERAETETRLQRALRTPNVTVGGGYQRNFGADAFVLGVTVPLPLWNRNQGGIARARAEQARARNRATAAAALVRFDVQQAVNAAEVSRARVTYIEQEYLVPARESRDIVFDAYRLGTADLTDYLDAQRAFRDTLRTYNRALYDRRLSLFELAAATGSANAARVIR